MNKIRYLTAGDSGLVMEFGNKIDEKINADIAQVVAFLDEKNFTGILDVLPTYRSILINYDPSLLSYKDLVNKLKEIKIEDSAKEKSLVRLIEIPTLYGGEFGPDIKNVAKHANLSEKEVIKIHSGTDYLVYMMGFLPGFTYLGGLDKRLTTPRLKSPRLKIAPGSVGIANNQTGMYPSESPGGWQLIGRTPLKLYDESKEEPVFIKAGDYIRYVPIDEKEYEKIKKDIDAGKYEVSIKKVKRGELHG